MSDYFYLLLSNGELYPYSVVVSKRAKYIRIKLSLEGELSVVCPSRRLTEASHDFLRSKINWVEKNLRDVCASPVSLLPEVLEFPMLMETWNLNYTDFPLDEICLIEKPKYQLDLQGNMNAPQLIKKKLNIWCQSKAKALFSNMLEEIAEINGFHYNRLTIRSQKTRWGSCSSGKNISLNSKLLLMPEDIVRYVMIHELCHTIEMNHSSRFWSLVEDCDPNFSQHRKDLSILGKEISL